MTALVDIANRALMTLKRGTLISLDDGSREATILKAAWPTVRDTVLRKHPWNCVTARAQLANQSEGPVFGAMYSYKRLPHDLKVRDCDVAQGVKWKVEGRSIVTDAAPPLGVVFTARIDDPNVYDALLIEALQAHLAFATAMELTQKTSLRDLAEREYDKALSDARSIDGQEGTKDRLHDDTWLGSRRRGNVQEFYGTGRPWV